MKFMDIINLIIDTNVIVSAFLSNDINSVVSIVVSKIFDYNFKFYYSTEILSEYIDVLNREKFNFNKLKILLFIEYIRFYGIKINPQKTYEAMIDEKNRPFYDIFCELYNNKTFLITGNLKHFPTNLNIMSPSSFLKILNNN